MKMMVYNTNNPNKNNWQKEILVMLHIIIFSMHQHQEDKNGMITIDMVRKNRSKISPSKYY